MQSLDSETPKKKRLPYMEYLATFSEDPIVILQRNLDELLKNPDSNRKIIDGVRANIIAIENKRKGNY
jgi:hypothetical protein